MSDKMREALRAAYLAGSQYGHETTVEGRWSDDPTTADDYLSEALAAPPAPAVPDGWKLVPVEPTEAMLESARLATESEGLTTTTWLRNCVYRAMLAAAPEVQP